MRPSKTQATLLAATLLVAAPNMPALAQDWPNEELVISVIVPHAAGGGTDSAIRPLVEEMRQHLPARLQVANIGGAGSAQGTDELLSRPADGYSLLIAGTHTIGATMQGLTEGYHELEQVAALNWDAFIVAVLADRPYTTFAELVEAAQEEPGTLCLGNAGMGGGTGIASVAINLAFDHAFNVTPFDGGQNLRTDVLGGRCEAGIFSQSELLSNLDDFQPLAILTDERSTLEAFREVPTLAEAGFDNLEVPGGSFRSIAVRAGTPDEAKQALAEAIGAAYESDAYQRFMQEQGIISTFSVLDEAQAYFDELVAGYEPVVREAGLYRE